jgi:hypothetical protein
LTDLLIVHTAGVNSMRSSGIDETTANAIAGPTAVAAAATLLVV